MLKYISMFIIVGGFLLVVAGTYQYAQTENAQKSSLSEAYKVLKKGTVKHSSTEVEQTVQKEEIEFSPKQGDAVGILSIPRLNSELPIIEGTDEDELARGVGHYKGTAYPGDKDQIVLSGHRDTVFRRMGELKIGDELVVTLPYGSFTYTIERTEVVDADDTTIIKSTAPNEILVLSTCYPFSYVGSAPERYIIYATPKKATN
ncbi:class D sortase [Bacillus luteolus]|uniref:Class D sortase n=1 Tax=Litchfieldia luteola TaxID=682179 RepID=A0ABR9QHI0_9BACI|nr:class D sortase [Cytobacillus luteolus]MBE4907941.1 class D sortase [Cytobacillus luteolus]MBP1942720.1 sortase A [Cytobacillus luteolus]